MFKKKNPQKYCRTFFRYEKSLKIFSVSIPDEDVDLLREERYARARRHCREHSAAARALIVIIAVRLLVFLHAPRFDCTLHQRRDIARLTEPADVIRLYCLSTARGV